MSSTTNLGRKILEEIGKGNEIILVKTTVTLYFSAVSEILRLLTSISKGIYVSLTKPCPSIKKQLERDGVHVDNLIFVDCATRQFSGDIASDDGCMFIESPNPVQIAVYVERAMDMVDSELRFVYMDSLSTIALYKSPETLLKFMRQLTGRIRLKGFKGIIIVVENEIDPPYLAQLSLMCDSVVEVK
ncbi:DUF7504 family protein [Geoglobus sp.]